MKFSKSSLPYILSFPLALCPFSTLTADTFLLKDGTKVEGTIINETKRSYLLRAEISRNVYDEITVLKLDVTKHIEEDKSIKAFDKISKILPTPDLMSAKAYASIIDNQLKPFVRDFPESPNIEEVKEILDTLEAEQTVVLGGGIKLDGILLTQQDVTADKYEVSASTDLKKFIKFAQRKQYRQALSKLAEMEIVYPHSTQVRKAQKVALSILPNYERELKVLLSQVDEIGKRRDRTLGTMSPADRSRTESIFKNQAQKYETLLASIKAERGSVKWLPINQFYKGPIEANLQMIPKELARITNASKQPVMMAGALYRATLQALDEGDIPKAIEQHKKFKAEKPSAMFANNLDILLKERQKTQEEIDAQKAKEEKMLAEKRKEEERMAQAKAAAAKKIADEKRDKDVDGFLDIQKKKLEQIESLKQ